MTVPFPDGAIPQGMEIAFGADNNGDNALWEWTNVTNSVMAQTVTTTRGRADETADISPTQASLELDNPDGDFTPDDARSPYYPSVDIGTPARWWVETEMARLFLPPTIGARAEVASTAALDITSDLDVRIDLHSRTTDPSGANVTLAARYTEGGGYSWSLDLAADHKVVLTWSTTGTPPPDNTVSSTVPVLPSSARAILRATLAVDNGAGGHDVTFYLGTSMTGPWTPVGPTITEPGVTSIFNAAEPLVVGSPVTVSGSYMPDADVYAFALLDGIDGTPIADADFTAQPSGTTTFVDDAGRTWNIYPDAAITNIWFRVYGTIDEWSPTWPYGDLAAHQDGGLGKGQARTGITISGILRRLGQRASPLNSALRRSIPADPRLRAYWPMEDGSGSSQFASAFPDGGPMPVAGGASFASDSQLLGSAPLPKLTGTTFFSGPVTGVFSGQWEVDWYFNISLSSIGVGNTWSMMRVTTEGTVRTWEMRVNETQMGVFGLDASGAEITSTVVTVPASFYDHMTHVRLQATQVGPDVTWFLRWTEVLYLSTPIFGITDTYTGTWGAPTAVGITPGAGLNNMVMGHLAVLDAFDPFSSVSASPAALGWQGERVLERIVRLCEEEQIPLRVIGSVEQTPRMGPQSVATLLDLLDEAKDVDAGILYEQQYSVGLIYRTRTSLYNQPPNMILDGLDQEIQNSFQPILDDQRIRNVVTVQRRGGSSSTVSDQASVDKVGLYDDSVTLNLFSDSQTSEAAGWRLHQGVVPGMRYPSLTTNLGVAPEVIDDWVTCDTGSRIYVDGLPPQHPTSQVRVMMEGYSEPISPTTWVPTVNASPARVWDVAQLYGEWVPDEFLLRLDTDGSELTAAVDAVDTSLVVAITQGPPWVIDPVQFPFDISVEGERMTVLSISSATSPQTFTVIRSVNGVAKSHPIGAAVNLWFRAVLAR